MTQAFIKKEGIAQSYLSRYLLVLENGSRLKTIDELAKDSYLLVGLMQSALKSLEALGAITIERRGRNGSFVTKIDHKLLFKFANIGNVVCAMPLPYARVYEGLASGLKAQFLEVPFYFAHMRGSDIRIECLENGIYDLAVTSRLAAEQHLSEHNVHIALALGKYSYAQEHKLIYRQGELNSIRKVGVDRTSTDQKMMTEQWSAGGDYIFVDVSYHECVNKIMSHEIDAAIWNVGQGKELDQLGLTTQSLIENKNLSHDCFYKASEAVILTRKDDSQLQQLISTMIDPDALLIHQKNVIDGVIEPVY